VIAPLTLKWRRGRCQSCTSSFPCSTWSVGEIAWVSGKWSAARKGLGVSVWISRPLRAFDSGQVAGCRADRVDGKMQACRGIRQGLAACLLTGCLHSLSSVQAGNGEFVGHVRTRRWDSFRGHLYNTS
jgi:hypothetical protein